MHQHLHTLLIASFIIFAAGAIQEEKLFWFSSTHVTELSSEKVMLSVDFRGCFEQECVYVSSKPLFTSDRNIQPYTSQNLWVMSDTQSTSLIWIFSDERPQEKPTTLWLYPVATSKIIPSHFDSTPYIRNTADPLVAQVVESISKERMEAYVTYLAMNFNTRYSLSQGAYDAADFLKAEMTKLGCTNARLEDFRPNYSPNVLCDLPGDENIPSVWIGAHYDDIPTSGRAPGADDNASGSAGVIEMIIAFVNLTRAGASFRRPVHFAFWGGEEQGTIGSRFTATRLYNDRVQIHAYINLDMIAYPEPSQPTTLWWQGGSGVNRGLLDLGISLSKTYLGESTVIRESLACCSDQRSFHERGYPVAAVLESSRYANNPNYHRPTDLPNTISYDHGSRETKMAAALAATISEPRQKPVRNFGKM